jgi:hypothetical protein
VYAFHLGPYDFSVSKDPHGFLAGDANERAIRALSLAIAAPSLAADEIVKVPMTAEQRQPNNATTAVEFIRND